MRDATYDNDSLLKVLRISTYAPREGCDVRRWHSFFDFRISTHAPREGCDREMVIHSLVLSYFNSRTPCGVRHRSLPKVPPETYFNSRTQCGVRTRCSVSSAVVVSFQLTHPMRGTTSSICCRDGSNRISTHAPHAGYGPPHVSLGWPSLLLQLPHPILGATAWSSNHLLPTFQLTHPHGVQRWLRGRTSRSCFNSRTPRGVRHRNSPIRAGKFQLTSPCGGDLWRSSGCSKKS